MTFREKLQTELPNEICKGVPSACPTTYGYEKYGDRPCKGKELIDSAFCENCWNREMPNTDKETEESLNIIEAHNKAYEQGLNDAWELANKFCELDPDKRAEIYGSYTIEGLIFNRTPQEALAKLKAYEEQIEVGDVVEAYEKKFVIANITRTEDATTYFGIARDGMFMCSEDVKKTGKHIEIKSILEQIGE